MTLRDAFGGVDVLLPARVHKARERAAQAIRSDLSALIETLPTSSSSPAPGPLSDPYTEQGKAWALRVIDTLPTRNTGNTDDGNC
jgi:hypothetical protein